MRLRVKKNYEWKYCEACGKYKYLSKNRKTCSTICSRKYKMSGSYQIESYWRKKNEKKKEKVKV